ncbi:predicted protein [Histoplasma capsulatum H143]|uniref:Uncharacterized protein n=1 Tax=Ajellomyces capsulatus (strain H143) TaxID=544712 RepID=C6HDW8_AJECH|nr:predicted protein [Histoplasma capsulatum H143]
MAHQISQRLRQVADEIDIFATIHGDRPIEKLLDDGKFADSLLELSENLPEVWKKILRAREGRNPLRTSLKRGGKSEGCAELSESVRRIIWKWFDHPEEFITIGDDNSIALVAVAPFDPLVHLMLKVEDEIILKEVRWRVGSMFMADLAARFNTEAPDIAEILIQSKLLSSEYREAFSSHLPAWVSAGSKYNIIAGKLGGKGSVVYLPYLGRTMLVRSILHHKAFIDQLHSRYEIHFRPTGIDATATIHLLQDVPRAASVEWEGRTAYDIIDSVFKHLWSRTPSTVIIPHNNVQSGAKRKKCQTKQPRVRKRKHGGAQNPMNQGPSPTGNDSGSPEVEAARVEACPAPEGNARATCLFRTSSQPIIDARVTLPTAFGKNFLPEGRDTNITDYADGIPSQSQQPARLNILADTASSGLYSEAHARNSASESTERADQNRWYDPHVAQDFTNNDGATLRDSSPPVTMADDGTYASFYEHDPVLFTANWGCDPVFSAIDPVFSNF